MVTREDLESFLDRLTVTGASYEEVQPGLWIIRPGGVLGSSVVVHHTPPVVLLRVKVMDVPKTNGRGAELNRRLLELNASDLVQLVGVSRETITSPHLQCHAGMRCPHHSWREMHQSWMLSIQFR